MSSFDWDTLYCYHFFCYRRTPHKQCLCQFQFPVNYPDAAMLTELKSKVFSDKVLKTMSSLVEAELKKMTGRVQVRRRSKEKKNDKFSSIENYSVSLS